MNKKIKQNSYKPDPGQPGKKFFPGTGFLRGCLKPLLALCLVMGMSLGAIWSYDLVTQSPLFRVQKIDVSGTRRISHNEVIFLMGVTRQTNIFSINLGTLEKKITCHPWIAQASVKRAGVSTLVVTLVEQEAMAVVNLENQARIVINTQGLPFMEFDPQQILQRPLPVISGLELKKTDTSFHFEGKVFDAILELVKLQGFGRIHTIQGDENIGITIGTDDIYNHPPANTQNIIPIKLGFDRFGEKQIKAVKISRYMATHFPDKIICAMDLYNIEKVFIKTKENVALHHTLEKGA